MDQASLPRYRYAIDRRDVITSVCPLWLAFARENGAPQLTSEAVLGRSLWQFIDGAETKEMYQAILQRVRNDNSTAVVPFRCDSPTLRRYMRLELTPAAEGSVKLDGLLERVEQTIPYNFLEPAFPRSRQLLTLCSCCKRILLESSGWLEIDVVAVRLDLLGKQAAPKLRHTVCPECLAASNVKPRPRPHGQSADSLIPKT